VGILKIYRYENVIRLEGNSSFELLLYDKLSVKNPNAKFMKSYQLKKWDGFHRLYNLRTHTTFPGFYDYIIKLCKNTNIKYEIIDKRKIPTKKIELTDSIELRPYQKKALKEILKKESGIIWLPVNAGKTYIALKLISSLKLRTLWITHTKDLLIQTGKKMVSLFNFEPGVIGLGKFDIKNITIGMIQTLSKNYKDAEKMSKINNSFDIVIFDECHKVAHNSYSKFMGRAKMYYRYGLSGTPKHRNKVDVFYTQAVFGNILVKMTQQEMINLGVSTPPSIFIIRNKIEKIETENYMELYEKQIVMNEKRNNIAVLLTKSLVERNLQVLITLERLKHGEIISKKLKDLNINYVYIHGETPIEKRKEALAAFEAGEIPVLVSTTILNEGINLHSMDAIIVLGSGKSSVKTVQRVGRVLRKRIGKNKALIFDFEDKGENILYYQARKRIKTYKQEFKNVSYASF